MRMESGMRFAGKRAVVTGGASGIGRATALRLVEEGAEVLVGDVDEAGGAALSQGSGVGITLQRTGVTKLTDISAMSPTASEEDAVELLVKHTRHARARGTHDT